MEDTQSPELASDTTQDGLGTSDSTQPENGLVEQAASQEQSTEEPTLSALEQDKRYTEYWDKGNPDKMYNQITHLESKQAESQQTMKDMESLRQDLSQANEKASYYDNLLQDETTGPIYQEAFRNAQEAHAKATYGDHSADVLSGLAQRDQQIDQLNKQIQSTNDEMNYFRQEKIADQAVSNIEQKAKEAGIDPNLDGFLNYVKDNRIGPESYEMAWNMVAQDSIVEAKVKKAIEANTVAKKETMNGTVYSPSTASNQPPSNSSGRETMTSILNRIRGQAA